MSSSLDMSLDEIIRNRKGSSDRGGRPGSTRPDHKALNGPPRSGSASGSVLGPGPDRRFNHRNHPPRIAPYPTFIAPQMMQMPEPVLVFPAASGGFPSVDSGSGAKLYVSNLDYGVTNEDIKVLFSEVGELKTYSVHYDKSGRSKGTAEVVYHQQTDAVAAVKRYNNVNLDGKPMHIELVGVNVFAPAPLPPASMHVNSILGRPNGAFGRGQQSSGARGRGRGGGPSRGESFRGRGRGQRRHAGGEKVTAEALDADLDKYLSEAKKQTTN